MTSPVTARISKKVNFDRHRPFLGGRFGEGIWPTSGFSSVLPEGRFSRPMGYISNPVREKLGSRAGAVFGAIFRLAKISLKSMEFCL